MKCRGKKLISALSVLSLGLAFNFLSTPVKAETICAEVRLEIKQEATLEREAFDAALEV